MKLTNSHSWVIKEISPKSIQMKIHFWLFGKKNHFQRNQKSGSQGKVVQRKSSAAIKFIPDLFLLLSSPSSGQSLPFLHSRFPFLQLLFDRVPVKRQEEDFLTQSELFEPVSLQAAQLGIHFFYVSFHFKQLEMQLREGHD